MPAHASDPVPASLPSHGPAESIRHNLGGAERVLSTVGGVALAVLGLRRGGLAGLGAALAAGELLRRGLSGRSALYGVVGVSTMGGRLHADHADVDEEEAVAVERSVTIARPRAELFAAWRDLERLPRFIDHLERVELLSPARSRWTARGPGGVRVQWDAAVTQEREGERIAWETIEPTDVPHHGEILFADAPGGRGTEVRLRLEYEHPLGETGRALARALPNRRLLRPIRALFGRTPDEQVRAALRRFKQIMEAGEVATTAGQPSGREPERRHA